MKRSFNMMGSGATGVNVNYGTVVQVFGGSSTGSSGDNKTKKTQSSAITSMTNIGKSGGVTTVVRSPVDGKFLYLNSEEEWRHYAKWKRLRKFWHIAEALASHGVPREVGLAVHALLFEPLQHDIVVSSFVGGDSAGAVITGKRVDTPVPVNIATTPLSVIEALIPVLTSHTFVAGGACRAIKKTNQLFRFSLGRDYYDANLWIEYRRESPLVMETSTVINSACMEWSLLDYLIVMAEREQLGEIFSGPC